MEYTHSHSEHIGHSNVEHHAVQKRSWKTFVPLAVIFGAVFLFTAIMLLWLGRWDFMFAMRNFMAAFFLIFGFFKIINWKGFVSAYMMYDIIAKRSKAYAYAYPVIEIGLGFAYLFSFHLITTNIITLVVMLVSAVGVANELRKKQEITCACLGAVFKIPMTKVTLAEDVLMAGMALWMLFILL